MTTKTASLSCLLFAILVGSLPAQNDRPRQGHPHPSFIKPENAPDRSQAKQMFQSLFDMKEKDGMYFSSSFKDDLGFLHETYQQHYDGIKVEGATYRLHLKDNLIETMTGHFMDIFEDISVTPGISSTIAFQQALAYVNANRYIWDEGEDIPSGELVILADPDGLEPPRLTYKFDIYATAPLYRAYVYIDAQTGQFLKENLRIHHTNASATGVSLYNGTVSFTADYTSSIYRLRQTQDGNGVRTFDMNNGTTYSAATDITSTSKHFTSDNTGIQAHWGAEQTHKYYLQKHGRNSFDGNGAVINSYVHYSSSYNNAFWDGQRMTYGDGDGVNYNPLVSLDVVGHEITHGVVDHSADLVYSYESGALNESFADIFGEAVERYATGTNDWLIGAQIKITGSSAIRSMSNPKAFGDPDTYKSTYWYSGSGDNGGVHTNSGVQNKWFYILTVGESGTNDLGDSYNVAGIGFDKAAAIAYRNLSVYLSANSNYADARAGAIQAAIDLYGAGSPEVMATKNAWFAVGVGEPDGQAAYCSSKGNSAAYEWISQVVLGNFANASGSGGYTDFTSKTINVTAGQSYNIKLVPGFLNNAFNEYWRIWIDYNGDADFQDNGELVFDAGQLSSASVTGVVKIPAGATGKTRMRVSMKYEGAPTPCETFSYGEVEDYSIFIEENGGADTEPPSSPGNLTASNTDQTSTQLSWAPSTDNVGVLRYRIFVDGNSAGSTQSTNYTVGSLSPGQTYEMSVKAEDAAGNISSPSVVTVTTQGKDNSGVYCNAKSNNANSEWIAKVEIGAFSHASGGASYSNFTAVKVPLLTGQTYDLSLTPAFSGTQYNEYWRIWIDYNGDGDFDDNGELAFDAGKNSNTIVRGSMKIPAGLSGSTRMRVTMKYNNPPSPCETFNYGEVEDYTVSFGGSEEDTQPPTAPENLQALNTTPTTTDLSWSPSTDNIGVTGYNVYIDGILKTTTVNTNYTVVGLTARTTYQISVTAEDAARNESTKNTIQVTTPQDESAPAYCASKGSNATSEWIASVQVGDFTNSSGRAGYSDFTGLKIDLQSGQSYPIQLKPGFASTTYNEYWRIWIDFNRDGDFQDEGELAFDAGNVSKVPVNGNISIPENVSGLTRMRVSMKYNNPPSPCENFNYGEVEDYTVFIDNLDGDGAPITLFAHYFETGWDGWSDGGTDCYRYNGPYSWEGNYSIRLRDDSGIASAMTSDLYNLSGYYQLELQFYFYPTGMEYGKDLLVLYYDGFTWRNLASLVSGIDFENNTFYKAILSFDESGFNFPANARFRFQCDADNDTDQVYIDAVTARVYSSSNAVLPDSSITTTKTVTLASPTEAAIPENALDLAGPNLSTGVTAMDLTLFPNPAWDVLYIQTPSGASDIGLYSAAGVLLREIPVEKGPLNRLDVSSLHSGMYYLVIQTEHGSVTRKFVKR